MKTPDRVPDTIYRTEKSEIIQRETDSFSVKNEQNETIDDERDEPQQLTEHLEIADDDHWDFQVNRETDQKDPNPSEQFFQRSNPYRTR